MPTAKSAHLNARLLFSLKLRWGSETFRQCCYLSLLKKKKKGLGRVVFIQEDAASLMVKLVWKWKCVDVFLTLACCHIG